MYPDSAHTVVTGIVVPAPTVSGTYATELWLGPGRNYGTCGVGLGRVPGGTECGSRDGNFYRVFK